MASVKVSDKPLALDLIKGLLFLAKSETFRRTYARLAPGEDGRIRTVHGIAATDTGRYNSSDTFLENSTNLQNISKKYAILDPLFDLKQLFLPDPGYVIGEADLSQAEARVAAWMAQDPLAIDQYERGVDRYKFLAAAVFHDEPEAHAKVTKAQRQVGKMGQLALQYGVSWKTFMEQANSDADLTGVTIDARTAKAVEAVFHALYPGYPQWWGVVEDRVLTAGYLTNPYGRRRDFFGRADSESARAALRRAAVAFLPQSTIADHTNDGLCKIYEELDPHLVRIHLQVHDAIVFQCKPQDAHKAAKEVKKILERPLEINGRTLLVPAEVSVSTKNWSNVKRVA